MCLKPNNESCNGNCGSGCPYPSEEPEMERCEECNGTGKVIRNECEEIVFDGKLGERFSCEFNCSCTLYESKCEVCNGTGEVEVK